MLRFESPIYLWLLLLIPHFVALMLLMEWYRKKQLKRLGDKSLIQALMPDDAPWRRWIKFALVQLAIAFLVLVIARPQMGAKTTNEKRNGIEAIICLDISNSMLAEDVQPSRLQKSKMLVENLVDKFYNDKIGLVVFAGDAFVQLPITSDFVSAKMFLQNAEPNLINVQGTDIAHAISLAESSFTKQKNIGRAIIVITDGEDHEGGAMEAAKAAKEHGINVFILGVGSTSGAPIPTSNGYMTDNTGETVMTKLNEDMCREIASAGHGSYIHVDNTSTAQEQLDNALAKLQKGEMESVVYSEYSEQYQYFGLVVLLLLILEVCVNTAVNPYLRKIILFDSSDKQRRRRNASTGSMTKMLLVLMLLSCTSAINAQDVRTYIRQGNKEFRDGNVTKAEVAYRKALILDKNNPQVLYNLGCVLQQQEKDSAVNYFLEAGRLEKTKLRKAMCYHNIGTIYQKKQAFELAVEAYKDALRNNPNDDETRYNLVLCQRQIKKSEGGKKPNDGGNNKDKNKDKQQDQKEQKNDQNNNKDNQKEQPKEQPKEQMSKENAEALLKAAEQDEKRAQQKAKQMQQNSSRKLQKNW